MINNQWYAVLSSRELKKGKILGVRRFGRNLIFVRNNAGDMGCFDSLCAHRKASLKKGWVKEDHIKCPFHGIEYDITGKCVYVPSNGRTSAFDLARFHLKSYPVKEIGGIVFVWYGEKEPSGEPNYFEIITNKSYKYDEMNDMWNVDYSRVIENQLDVSHLAFVHKTTIGRGNKTLCNGPKVVWLDSMTMQTSANNEVDKGQTPKSHDESEIKNTNLTFKFPNMWLNHVSDKIMILAFFVPVDDKHSIIYLRFYNKITGLGIIDKSIAWMGSRANKVIERQDKRVVETQLPKKSGVNIGENLVPADMPIVQYRTRRKALQDNDDRIADGESDSGNASDENRTNNHRAEAVGKTSDGRTVWRCKVCGYEWVGEELPDDFVCPVCKHSKESFERVI